MPSRLSRPLRRVWSGTCEWKRISKTASPPGGIGSASVTRITVSWTSKATGRPFCVSERTSWKPISSGPRFHMRGTMRPSGSGRWRLRSAIIECG